MKGARPLPKRIPEGPSGTMVTMDVHVAALAKAIDPAVLGRRIRDARIAAGMTPAEVVAADASTADLSRIEAGQQRPDPQLLEQIAARLEVPLTDLLAGVTHTKSDELRLQLDFAELALASGHPQEALEKCEAILAEVTGTEGVTLARTARYLHACALEACGDLTEAILELEDLTGPDPVRDLTWIEGVIALSRCHREAGDLGRAIETGEQAEQVLAAAGLLGTPEAVQLTLTVAAAYFERGDTGHAVRMCLRASAEADELNSPKAKASAYWNAAVMEWMQGRVHQAMPLARQALSWFETSDDSRNAGRLRTQLALIQLRLDPPEVADAKANLELARRELDWSGSSSIDKADADLGLARVHFLLGDRLTAATLASAAYDETKESATTVAATALVLMGQIAASQGQLEEATRLYREAILVLTGIGADRAAGTLWFELGDLLEEVGERDAARSAYRSAAVSAGLVPRGPVRSPAAQQLQARYADLASD